MLGQTAQSDERPLPVQYVSALSETPGQDFTVYSGDMLVYLGFASRTGGDLVPLEHLQAAVDKIAAAAPHAKILCGFGIRTAADVAYIRRLRGVHGVTIGTEALSCLSTGLTDFAGWLAEIDGGLTDELG